MRIHHLAIEAFGPFAGAVEVDLDALSDAGLFLLTGATGAGKTSVLDAICFALYGAVPGDRQIAKRLRADQAAAGVAPRVAMELTLAGRRLRVDRSPAWERPKKRGTGTTLQQASVLVEERVAGEWVPRATRLDEAGHLLGDLLGMTQTQFCQVQLLPQGQFQTFLRSGSQERHRLLQQLFRTSRFEDVEEWLRERRRVLSRASSRRQDDVADLLSRVSEAAGVDVPEGWDLRALAPRLDDLDHWSADLLATATAEAHAATESLDRAVGADAAARVGLDDGRRLLELRRRHARATAEHEELVAHAAAHEADVARLQAGRRAVAVLPVAAEAARLRGQLDGLRDTAAEDLAAAAALLDEPGELAEDRLEHLLQQATDAAARTRAELPLAAERERLEAAARTDRARLAELAGELAATSDDARTLPGQLSGQRATEAEARRAVDAVPAVEAELAVLRERHAAALSVDDLLARRAEAADLLRGSVDTAQLRRETWLQLQEARLEGMAAEIAGRLAVGSDCPVCGSADHPHPARPSPGAPDAEAVRRARVAVDDAEAERLARELAVSDLDARIAAARDRAGHRDPTELEREVAEASARVTGLRARAATLPDEVAAREALEARQVDLQSTLQALATEQASVSSTLAERDDRLAELRARLRDLLEGTGLDGLTDLLARQEQAVRVLAAASRSALAVAHATREAQAAADRAGVAAREAGFDDEHEARRAARAAGDLDDLQRQVDDHRARRAAVTAALADPELRAAAVAPAPDLDALVTEQARAAALLDDARVRATTAERRRQRLEGLRGELLDALAAWSPLRTEHDLVDRVATLADGSSPDNRLRMRLSGYVLAFRLRQVVAAANERLTTMLDGRYLLEHAGDRGAGETRGGLSLRVRDEWSGETRDPVTLSGGETFVVSLALALGLADVITQEAGGAELDTLFVDEGFGTLDADSLDHVMDMLDGLRDGGRVVGVVSHVAELQTRVPTQLHVAKHRSGSTLHQQTVG